MVVCPWNITSLHESSTVMVMWTLLPDSASTVILGFLSPSIQDPFFPTIDGIKTALTLLLVVMTRTE